MENKSFTNCAGKKVLEYLSPDTIVLDLPFIMTCGKRLTLNMPYLKLEQKVAGNDIKAVRLLNFDDADGIVNLYVQELDTKKTFTLSSNMEYDGDYWLWSIADIETLTNLPK